MMSGNGGLQWAYEHAMLAAPSRSLTLQQRMQSDIIASKNSRKAVMQWYSSSPYAAALRRSIGIGDLMQCTTHTIECTLCTL